MEIEQSMPDYKIEPAFEIEGFHVTKPSFYRGCAVTALFLASHSAATDELKKMNLTPISLTFNKTFISLTIFDFFESPVGPYQELVYSLPVMYGHGYNAPIVPLLFHNSLKNFGFYVIDIFQSTKIAVRHGELLTGYPHNRNLIDIKFNRKMNEVEADVLGNQSLSLNLKVGKSLGKKDVHRSYNTFFSEDDRYFKIQMDIHGEEIPMFSGHLKIFENNFITEPLERLKVSKKTFFSNYYPNVIEVNPVLKKSL